MSSSGFIFILIYEQLSEPFLITAGVLVALIGGAEIIGTIVRVFYSEES